MNALFSSGGANEISGNVNTWVNSDLPAVDIIDLIHNYLVEYDESVTKSVSRSCNTRFRCLCDRQW